MPIIKHEDIKNKVYNIIKQLLTETHDIEDSTPFSDLNINSLSYIRMVIAIEDEFSFEFDDEKLIFSAFPYVVSVYEYILEKYLQRPNQIECKK